jgi:hypothetical protein
VQLVPHCRVGTIIPPAAILEPVVHALEHFDVYPIEITLHTHLYEYRLDFGHSVVLTRSLMPTLINILVYEYVHEYMHYNMQINMCIVHIYMCIGRVLYIL